MEAADGIYSIPPSSPDAADAAGGMAAKHARANAMAQTITLLELIIKPISLSAWCRGVSAVGILGTGTTSYLEAIYNAVSCRYCIKPSRPKILTRHNPIVPSDVTVVVRRVCYARSLAAGVWTVSALVVMCPYITFIIHCVIESLPG